MDYAASTPVLPEVIDAMKPFWNIDFGNPSSIHTEGKRAKEAVQESRKTVAREIGAKDDEIVFTASGTEANNLAILGTYEKLLQTDIRRFHFLTTNIEHSSVDGVFRYLKTTKKVPVSYVPVFSDGIISLEDVEKNIQKDTRLVSIMYVNNEIGTVQPVYEIGKMIEDLNKEREDRIYFHVDAAQAPLYFDIDVKKMKVDFLTLDAQKIYGPKGVGVLYVRNSSEPRPIMFGGSHEKGLRPGTENVPGVVGLSKALEIAGRNREDETARMKKLQKYFFDKLDTDLPEVRINGSKDKRSPNNVNISISSIRGDYLVLLLDEKGISASAASACHSGRGIGSRIIRALSKTVSGDRGSNSIRFTMGKDTTENDIDRVISALKQTTSTLDF